MRLTQRQKEIQRKKAAELPFYKRPIDPVIIPVTDFHDRELNPKQYGGLASRYVSDVLDPNKIEDMDNWLNRFFPNI